MFPTILRRNSSMKQPVEVEVVVGEGLFSVRW